MYWEQARWLRPPSPFWAPCLRRRRLSGSWKPTMWSRLELWMRLIVAVQHIVELNRQAGMLSPFGTPRGAGSRTLLVGRNTMAGARRGSVVAPAQGAGQDGPSTHRSWESCLGTTTRFSLDQLANMEFLGIPGRCTTPLNLEVWRTAPCRGAQSSSCRGEDEL